MTTPTTFSTITKCFHWLTALLILTIIPLGLIANQLPFETSEHLARKALFFSMHKTLGVAIFFVALARILWSITQAKPGSLHPDRKAETLLAQIIHWVLYISLVAVPLIGWIEHAATSGFAPIWWPFGQSLPFVPKSDSVASAFAGLHWIFGKLMVASILLHIAGALKHHFIDKDVTLKRMWFGRAQMPTVGPHKSKRAAPMTAILAFIVATGSAFALGLTEKHGEDIAIADLAAVQSDWEITDGSIAITITQFGSEVTGRFAEWTSEISFDPAPADVMGSVETVIAIGSLTIGSVTSDAMTADYFNVDTHPTATFTADIKPSGDRFLADGILTIKGTSVPIALPFDLERDGNTAQMTGAIELNRMDFNVGESQTDDASLGFAVQVKISVNATKPTN